jgi:hypothetical protein
MTDTTLAGRRGDVVHASVGGNQRDEELFGGRRAPGIMPNR